MSVQEWPASLLKPEVKPKPEIPPGLLHRTSPSPVGGGSTQGKVKKIAKRFTKQDSSEAAGEQLVTGAAELSPSTQVKKPPETRPKPNSIASKPEAPPLPKKRSRFLRRQTESIGEESEGMNIYKRRSAPDGKEVEDQGTGAAEANAEDMLYTPLSRCCNITCTCVCHLKRPGMMLIWVPVDEDSPRGEGQINREGRREEKDVRGQKANQIEALQREEQEVGGQEQEYESELPAQKKEGELKAAEDKVEKNDSEKKRDEHEEKNEVEQQKVEKAFKVGMEGEPKEAEKTVHVQREETAAELTKEMEVNAADGAHQLPQDGAHGGKIGEKIKEGENEGKGKNGPKDVKMAKSQFHQSLEIALAGGLKKLSDHGSLASLTRCQPLPQKNPQPPPVPSQHPEDDEESSIYELHLPDADRGARKLSSSRNDLHEVPKIKVHQPARREKPSHGPPDTIPELENTTEPPPILPRVPVNGSPVYNGNNLTTSRVRPQLPKTSPPSSPLLPCRPPPAPPKTHSRRASSVSMQSANLSEEEDKRNGEEEDTDQSPVRRTVSFKLCLTDEPLYQTYNDFAIKKEIHRQTVIRNISKTSMDYATEFAARFSEKPSGKSNGNFVARLSPVPAVSQTTLWQEHPTVRESGLLDQLTVDQIKYQESMFEVLTSETSYLRSLYVLTEHFMENRELAETIIISERKTLFSNILKVREVSERFLKDLEEHIFKEIVFPDICNILHYHAQHNFSTYIDYVRNQTYQEKTFSRLMKSNEQFATVINRLQELPQCQRLPFISFLLLPFQRITRIKMLIENILKRTKEGTPEEQTASKALASVSKIIDQCNRDVGKMRQMEELIEISKALEFDKLRAIPIISETRFLEKKGELQEMSKAKTFVNMRARFSAVYLFLFNDHLLITVKKSSDRYVVMDHTHRSLVQAQPLDECFGGATYENCFNLVMLENHQGRPMERVLKAPTKSDMQRWLAAFPSTTKEDVDEEVIYEDWDCPQVQCVEQYIAQQSDELGLEPTEIVNVIRKTNEGWYEGMRLSDGQTGWFPDTNVIEITNEHVRRRNIKERYRVSQATMMVKYGKAR
ncbi:rho guanine nucleotide exchange factor 15 [Xiphophorus hellerii]|uniref:rho guanine nucleotide exchange factor 15 n=1 Tax=Xiphophorus hellerii TaxID=8084 RepID=UPI0013B472DA|nr:rho guanine nucleotide exchange factor 15-like [Xiphophorus hellerii]